MKNEQKTEDVNEMTETYKNFMLQNIGQEDYNSIYNKANDTVKNWVSHGVRASKMQKYASDWTLDSIFCLNTMKDKSIMAILNKKSSTVSNSINYLYGVKIEEVWYFFYGPTLYVDSGMNERDAKTFDELHKIAMKEVFRGYLKKNKAGEWEINERFFGDIDRILAIHKGKFETEEEWERWWTKSVIEANWSRRDTSSKKLQ